MRETVRPWCVRRNRRAGRGQGESGKSNHAMVENKKVFENRYYNSLTLSSKQYGIVWISGCDIRARDRCMLIPLFSLRYLLTTYQANQNEKNQSYFPKHGLTGHIPIA